MRLHYNDTWRPVVDEKYYPATAEELSKENHDFNLFISDMEDDGYAWLFEEWDTYENFEGLFSKTFCNLNYFAFKQKS